MYYDLAVADSGPGTSGDDTISYYVIATFLAGHLSDKALDKAKKDVPFGVGQLYYFLSNPKAILRWVSSNFITLTAIFSPSLYLLSSSV